MSKKSVYITTTLPYVNAEPHVGFAMEIIHADIIARFKKLSGYDVFFNTGTDEHGTKVWQAAQKARKGTQIYTDELAKKFEDLKELLGLEENLHFVRTTSTEHKRAAQEIWNRCKAGGFIDKKNYKIKYCTGCELEKTDSELVDGRCPIHPDQELEVREEKNYFFKFREFGAKLLKLYEEKKPFILPEHRLNEIIALINRGLEDFSISRLKEKMPWGVPVPDDDKQVMYVWFDALTSYISTLGWPDNEENFKKYWTEGTPIQFAGKDQVRQQAAMWQAMLMAAGLPTTDKIVIHGFLNFAGEKMSKSLGNVISPIEIVEVFGQRDALRYFVAREFNQFEDTDISWEKLKESYNANLANGLGNLVSRLLTMAEQYGAFNGYEPSKNKKFTIAQVPLYLEVFDIKKAIDAIWLEIGDLDKFIQDRKPFVTFKTNKAQAVLDVQLALARLEHVAENLEPFMPETSKAIKKLIKENISPVEPLFPRIP